MKSKITGGETEKIMDAVILNKYQVSYYQCKQTGFIQTEEPYWLNESYSSAITKLDVGLVNRNLILSDHTSKLIRKHFNAQGIFIDFAGGYGLFTRLMRDKGFNYFHTDIYCQNIFAEYFDMNCIDNNTHFDLMTAFEVFEHMTNPMEEITELFEQSDSVLFSTELLPFKFEDKWKDWWYFSYETGQHISFHTHDSLAYIAKRLDCHFYSNGSSLHLFTTKRFTSNPFDILKPSYFEKKFGLLFTSQQSFKSLIQEDWLYIKKILASQ